MNELEKLREENKALKLLLEMQDAYIDSLNMLHEARVFLSAAIPKKKVNIFMVVL